MESRTVTLQALMERDAWKAEFFLGPAPAEVTSAAPSVPLHSVVSERREFLTPSDHPTQEFNFLGLQHVASLTGLLVDYHPARGETVRSRSKVFRKGDVLYARLRPYLNKVYVALDGVEDGVCSGEFYVLVPDTDRIRPRFLRWVLSTKLIQHRVASLQAGSTHPRLALRDLLDFDIPLPPLAEQERLEAYLREAEDETRLAIERAAMIPVVAERELLRCLQVGSRSRPSKKAWPSTPEPIKGV